MSKEPRMEKQPEGEQKFESWLKENDFTPETVSALLANGVTSQRILECLSQTNIDDFKLNLGQRMLLKNVVKTLRGRPQVEVTAVAGGKAEIAVAAGHLGKHDGKTEQTSVKGVTGGEVHHVYAFGKADGEDLKKLFSKGEECPKQPAVPREEDCYKMTSTPRGHCYIFNNKNFKNKPKRTGTDHDKDGLTKIFKELKFKVSEFNNKEADDMMTEIQNLSKETHNQHDCVVLIFLTHGTDGRIYGSDDDSLRVDDITNLFKADNCKSLAHKPKIFFFASCRGTTFPKGVTSDGAGGAGDRGQEIMDLVAPEAHFFIGYATAPGKKALRNEEMGSWYIEALIKVLEESAHRKDFLSLMTDVKRVLHERQCESAEGDFLKQAAVSAHSLHRKLYL